MRFRDPKWKRAYVIWSHANDILKVSNTDLFCIDAVSTLKRAIDHRIKLLFEIYRFKDIPIKEKPSGHYEILHHFGIIRSRMVKKLIEIRNKIEHEAAFPPDEEACRDYVELTWYFLRSTDFLVRQVTHRLASRLRKVTLTLNITMYRLRLTHMQDGFL